MCRIGNGHGISSGAVPIYDELISRWQDNHILYFIKLSLDSEISSRLQFDICQQLYQNLATRLIEQATHPNIKLALEFIRDFPTIKMDKLKIDSRFKNILKTLN